MEMETMKPGQHHIAARPSVRRGNTSSVLPMARGGKHVLRPRASFLPLPPSVLRALASSFDVPSSLERARHADALALVPAATDGYG